MRTPTALLFSLLLGGKTHPTVVALLTLQVYLGTLS